MADNRTELHPIKCGSRRNHGYSLRRISVVIGDGGIEIKSKVLLIKDTLYFIHKVNSNPNSCHSTTVRKTWHVSFYTELYNIENISIFV